MSQKLGNLLRAFYSYTSGRVKIYDELPSLLKMTIGARQGPHFAIFILVIENLTGSLQDASVELANDEMLFELDYANGLVCLFEGKKHAKHVLDRFTRVLAPFGVCFAHRR